MTKYWKVVSMRLLVAGLLASLLLVSVAHAQQPAYTGRFTLTNEVRWGNTTLRPGDYILSIQTTKLPLIAQIRTTDGKFVAQVASGAMSRDTHGLSALLMKGRDGQLTVYSLALADLGEVYIFDTSLAHEPVREAAAQQTVPVALAKK